MIEFAPTESGGRLAQGDTPHGRYRVEWDSAGELVSAECEPRDPSPLDLDAVHDRMAVCNSCRYAGDVTTTKRGRGVYTIRCGSKRKGCGAVQLRHAGRCPEGKW